MCAHRHDAKRPANSALTDAEAFGSLGVLSRIGGLLSTTRQYAWQIGHALVADDA